MRRIVLLVSILLLPAVWAVAQYGGGANSGSGAANQMKIEGCVAGVNGVYTLTDQTGITYLLTGNTEPLKSEVGQDVRVTAVSASTANQPGSMSEDAGAQMTLSVISFEHISASCGSAY